jgi:hypothetical protein
VAGRARHSLVFDKLTLLGEFLSSKSLSTDRQGWFSDSEDEDRVRWAVMYIP